MLPHTPVLGCLERIAMRLLCLLAGLVMLSAAPLQAQTLRLQQAGAPATAIENGIETSDPWGTGLRLIKV